MKYFCILLVYLLPACASAEVIQSFTSDISLSEDGSFIVEETIVYDFEETQRHGIYRDISKQHPQEASSFWKTRSIAVSVEDVMLDGGPVPYELSDSSDNLNIKIGDASQTIDGRHTYTIAYTVDGGLSYFGDQKGELYWNVTGNGWPVSIQRAEATVHGNTDAFASERACYKGSSGETTPCDETTQDEGGVYFAAYDLSSSEGLTIAQALYTTAIETNVVEHFNIILLVLLIVPSAVLALVVFGYRYRTYFKTGAPIIAQYEPYEHCKPMYAGMLLDGVLDPRDITAGIVYLAEQGYIKIRKTEKKALFFFEVDDYEIELLRPLSAIESTFLQDVLQLLFTHGSVHDVVALSSLKHDLGRQKRNYALLQQLRKDLKKDMQSQGFFQVNDSLLKSLFVFLGGIFVLLFLVDIIVALFAPELLLFTLVACGAGIAVLAIVYERRTRRGYEAQDHLKGFKRFLSVTDGERFAFHNAPQKSPEQFMQYLPYAIAFGVEKQWADAFKDITIPDPEWYDAQSTGSFSAVNLTSSLGAFSTSFAASSGTSGSSGGGSSGGGGGGGGGGSW